MEFRQAIQALSDSGADFVVIGGVAAMIRGSARFTLDLDVCYSCRAANLKSLKEALAPFHPRPRGFPAGLPFIWDEAALRNSSVLTLETHICLVDLSAEVAGLGSCEEIKSSSKIAEVFGRRIAVLDITA